MLHCLGVLSPRVSNTEFRHKSLEQLTAYHLAQVPNQFIAYSSTVMAVFSLRAAFFLVHDLVQQVEDRQKISMMSNTMAERKLHAPIASVQALKSPGCLHQ